VSPPPAPSTVIASEPLLTPLPASLPAVVTAAAVPSAAQKPSPTPAPRARLAPVPPPPADAVEAIAAELAQAAHVEGPLLVTVEHGAAQSTLSFGLAAAQAPLDVFTVGRIARAHGAVVVSLSDGGGALRATLLLARPPHAPRPGAAERPPLLTRANAAWRAWRGE
jgi:hypothetical protein